MNKEDMTALTELFIETNSPDSYSAIAGTPTEQEVLFWAVYVAKIYSTSILQVERKAH
jgi:hypothetical protein